MDLTNKINENGFTEWSCQNTLNDCVKENAMLAHLYSSVE